MIAFTHLGLPEAQAPPTWSPGSCDDARCSPRRWYVVVGFGGRPHLCWVP